MNHLQKLKNNSLCSVITKNKMLSVLLVGVMMCGSIPLGFSEPILKQWENTQDITQISCNDIKHVLVMRSNGEPACVTERTADKLGWEIVENVKLSALDFDANTLFIKSDKLNPNIPTGQYTKWTVENVVRIPPPIILSEREQVVITDPSEIIIPQNAPDSTSNTNESQTNIQRHYSDYFDYFPSYVPDGMEMKGFTFSTFDPTTFLIIYYAPINTEIDFDTMNHYEFLDAGGIMLDLAHRHGDNARAQGWENWKLVFPVDAEFGTSFLHDEENHVYVAYGGNFLSLSMHEYVYIQFDTSSFSGDELYKMAETIMDAKAP